MFINMILKTIPRSIRAGVALLAAVIFVGAGFSALQQLVVPGQGSAWTAVRCVGCLLIGMIATVVFYYFQSVDGQSKAYSELETLDKYYRLEREKERLKNVEITPAYDDESKKQIKKQ